MKYLSLFSGMGGFDLALDRAGFECAGQVEIDATCRRVLAKHWPNVQPFNDVSTVNAASLAIRPDIIAAGWPCQDLSVAGNRAGLGGARSGLFAEFVRIVDECRPRWILGENVPGLYSSFSPTEPPPSPETVHRWEVEESSDFAAVVNELAKLGYGLAWRCFDAQYFGLAQRRERVLFVGHLGDASGLDAASRRRDSARFCRLSAQVLFEPESLPWDSPPSREAGTRVAASPTSGTASGSGVNRPARRREDDVNLVSHALTACSPASGRLDPSGETFVTHTLRGEGFDASEDGTGRGVPLVPIPFDTTQITSRENRSKCEPGSPCHSLSANQHAPAVAFAIQERAASESETSGPGGKGYQEHIAFTLEARHHAQSVSHNRHVRRLTPTECLRLMGFPDDWFDGLGLSDSAMYRMTGNSVAVPKIEWVARRIAAAEATEEAK